MPMSGLRRRRVWVAGTLVVGTVLLGASLNVAPASPWFPVLATALAAAWLLGGLASGPVSLGWVDEGGRLRRPVLVPILTGVLLGAVFVVGALVVREIGPLRGHVEGVLAYAGPGEGGMVAVAAGVAVLNAVAEEIFFRGAVFDAVGAARPVLLSTVVYVLATVATGNPMLVFAAVVVAPVFAWQRLTTGGVLAPALTHVTWSMLMLFVLPPVLS